MKNILILLIPVLVLFASCSKDETLNKRVGLETFGDLSVKTLFEKQLELGADDVAYVQFESNSFGNNNKPKIVLGANVNSKISKYTVNQYSVPENEYGNFYQYIHTGKDEKPPLVAPFTLSMDDDKQVFEGGNEIKLASSGGTVDTNKPFYIEWESETTGDVVLILKEEAIQSEGQILKNQNVKYYVVSNTGSFTVPEKDIAGFKDFTVTAVAGEARNNKNSMFAVAYINHSGTYNTNN